MGSHFNRQHSFSLWLPAKNIIIILGVLSFSIKQKTRHWTSIYWLIRFRSFFLSVTKSPNAWMEKRVFFLECRMRENNSQRVKCMSLGYFILQFGVNVILVPISHRCTNHTHTHRQTDRRMQQRTVNESLSFAKHGVQHKNNKRIK